MSDHHLYYIRTSQWRPRTWRQWVATLAFGAFVATMIVLAVAIAATFFVIAAAFAVLIAGYLYIRMLFSGRRRSAGGMRDITPYRDGSDA